MGTPNYPSDLSRMLRTMREATRNNTSVVLSQMVEGRPWSGVVVSDSGSSRWPSTTANTFSSIQNVSAVRTHPILRVVVSTSGPAAGGEVRITKSDGITVLSGPISIPSGSNTITMDVNIDTVYSYYAEFSVQVHIRSVTGGQTTSATIFTAYCKSA